MTGALAMDTAVTVPSSFPLPTSDVWDQQRLQFLVSLAVLYPSADCVPRTVRLTCGITVAVLLWANTILSVFVLDIYPSKRSIAACTDFCHSMCSLASHAVLVYLLETRGLGKIVSRPGMEDMRESMQSFDRCARRWLLRLPLWLYPTLGLTWWVTHCSQWLPQGIFGQRYGRMALLCWSLNTLTAWVWYSGPVCVMMLMSSVLCVHEAMLDNLQRRIVQGMLPSSAAPLYDRVVTSVNEAGSELQNVVGFILMCSMLAFATLVTSLLSTNGEVGFGPAAAYSAEEVRVVLQTTVLIGTTIVTVTRGARFTSKAGRLELCANSRLLSADICDSLRESLAVQQIIRRTGGWLVWGVRVDNATMVKILSIYGAGAYYMVTVCVRTAQSTPRNTPSASLTQGEALLREVTPALRAGR